MAEEKSTAETTPAKAEGTTTENPVAEGVKARQQGGRKATKKTETTDPATGDRIGPLSEEQAQSLSGISSFSVGGPRTLVGSFVAGHTNRDDYVTVDEDGYIDKRPVNSKRPVTQMLWQAGATVRKDYYEQYKDHVTSDPKKAKLYEPGT